METETEHGPRGRVRDLELELKELRCRTQEQEQCIVQYKVETEKLLALRETDASGETMRGETMHGMMKVWLSDARQQSEDLKLLFEESKVIAAETLIAAKREFGSKINKLQQQVVQLEADLAESSKARAAAEEASEKFRHELATAKRDSDFLRSELASSSGELSGKLTLRQNITKSEICKLSAEVFSLQQNLIEQAQRSAEAGKKGSTAYHQDLVSLNGLLERSREMRERDRAAFEAALEVANSDLRDKEALAQEVQDRLQHTIDQLEENRQHTNYLAQHISKMEHLASSNTVEAEELVVRAARMRTNTILLRAAAREWRLAVRPAHDISSRLSVLHDKRLTLKILERWRFNVLVHRRGLRKIAAVHCRWKAGRLLSTCLKWRHYTRARHHLQLTCRRIMVRFFQSSRSTAFYEWRVKSSVSKMLRRQELRAANHSDRACMRRALRVMLKVSSESKWLLVKGQHLVTSFCRRGKSTALCAWNGLVRNLQDSVFHFKAQKRLYRALWTLRVAFGLWFSACAPPSIAEGMALRVTGTQQRRRRICLLLLSWQQHASTRKLCRMKIVRSKQHVEYVRKQRTLRRLRIYVRLRQSLALRRQRVAAKTVRIVLVHTIRTWNELRMSRKISSVQNLRRTIRSTRTNLTQAIRKWRDGVVQARFQKRLEQRSNAKYILKQNMLAFTCFASHRLETRALRKKASSSAQRRLNKLCAWSLNAWVQSTAACRYRSRQDFFVNSRRKMLRLARLRVCTRWWLEYANKNKVLATLGRRIVSKWARMQSSEMMQAWCVMQHTKKWRNALAEKARNRRHTCFMIELMDSWSQSVHWSSLETSHKKEFDRHSEEFMAVKSHLQISLCKEADLQNNLNQLQDKEADLQNNLNQLQDVRIPALKSELELMQMELEAKGAEITSTKMQVSMLQDTIAELRGFLNDPDLKDDLNSNNTTMVETLQKEMEMERKSVLRLQLEAQHKDAEISQLSSQIAAMEHIVARSQKSIENLESQLSSDIQSVLQEKALAEQMFSELQKKLTDQFRAECDAKEAETAALKAHISVLQSALEEMSRDLKESSGVFTKVVSINFKSTAKMSSYSKSAVGGEAPKAPIDMLDRPIQGSGRSQDLAENANDVNGVRNELPCTQQGHATQETDIRKMKCDAVVEGEEGSWQVFVKCPSPQGTAELSSAPTKRDDVSTVSCDVSAVQSSVSCDMSAVQSSSPSLQSPYVEGDVYSINTHVAQISAAISSRPMQASNLFEQCTLSKPSSGQGNLVLTDKENVGLQSAIDVSESFDESSLCASNLTSVSLSGRESTGSASDMTVVAENATRSLSAEPSLMRAATTSFSRRAFGNTTQAFPLSGPSRSRKTSHADRPDSASIAEVARSRFQAPAISLKTSIAPTPTPSSSGSEVTAATQKTLRTRGAAEKPVPLRAASRRKRDYSLDSDSD